MGTVGLAAACCIGLDISRISEHPPALCARVCSQGQLILSYRYIRAVKHNLGCFLLT